MLMSDATGPRSPASFPGHTAFLAARPAMRQGTGENFFKKNAVLFGGKKFFPYICTVIKYVIITNK